METPEPVPSALGEMSGREGKVPAVPGVSLPHPQASPRTLESFDFARPRQVRQWERAISDLHRSHAALGVWQGVGILLGLAILGLAVADYMPPVLAVPLVEGVLYCLMLTPSWKKGIRQQIEHHRGEIERLRREHAELLGAGPGP